MNKTMLLAAAALWTGYALQPASAAPPDPQTQKIVDEVRAMAVKARKERSADPWLLQAMDDLVQRYYWPWRHTVAEDSFGDGDYSKSPAWEVATGSFWVDKSLGLRSKAVPAAQPSTKEKTKWKDAFKEALRKEMEGRSGGSSQTAATASAAEIYLPAKITNAFALDASFSQHQPPAEAGRIEFGLFEGTHRDRGYVLAITTGSENAAELLRVTASGVAVVERKPLPAAIATGELQKLSWRRDPDGGMVVLINDKTLIQTSDRGLTTPFRSLGITNRSGDFAVKQVTLADAG
jgi:hypothetical protein